MEVKESKVKDLEEKLRKGEITSDEARRELRKIGLGTKKRGRILLDTWCGGFYVFFLRSQGRQG